MDPIKISGIDSTIVAVPTKKAESSEVFEDQYRLAVVVKVHTDSGFVGLGEAPNPVGIEATKNIIDSTGVLLEGEDPLNVEILKKKLYSYFNLTHLHIHAACWALNSIDMALWDLVGKVCEQPLYKIWGGCFRDAIEYYGPVDRSDPETVSAQSIALVKEGFGTLYMKIGFSEVEDYACVKAIRDSVGSGIKIRLDANQSWSVGEATKIISQLAQFDIEFIEQPVLMYNLDNLLQIKANVNVPIAAHESSWTMYEALNVIKRAAADVIHIDPRFDAGMMGARLTAGMSEAAGIPVVMHSFGELGIAQSAYMHLIATTPDFTKANQSGYYALTDDIIKKGLLQFNDGCMSLPEGPGIGVELDENKVRIYNRYYLENIKGREFSKPWMKPQYMMMQYRRFFGY